MNQDRFKTYIVAPMGTGWDYLPTVRDVLCQVAGEEPSPYDGHHPGTAFDLNTRLVKTFVDDVQLAHDLARKAGMRTHLMDTSRVFWMPTGTGMAYGFVLKEYNQSTTYVISPVDMPHLEALKKAPSDAGKDKPQA